MSPLHQLELLRRGADCPSDLLLDRLQLGELDAAGSASVQRHADACDRCRQRLATFDVERRAFEAAPPWRLPAERPARVPFWRRGGAAIFGVAALAAVVGFFLVRTPTTRDGGQEATRTKGGVRFELFRARGEDVVALGDGDRVRPGDRIQVVYSAAAPRSLAVLARDGAGQLNVYFPFDRETTWPAAAGADVRLPASTELDGVLGRETLYLATCAEPTPLPTLRAAVAASMPPPPGCVIDVFTLTKEAAP